MKPYWYIWTLLVMKYLLTHSTDHSLSWENNRFSSSQVIPRNLWNPNVTNTCHLFVSWARSIQSMHPHYTTWRSILFSLSHLRLFLPRGLFVSGFTTKSPYAYIIPHIRTTCPTNLIILDVIIWIIFVTDHSTPHHVVLSTPLLPRPS